ncbi:MAG: ExbD/TolR family protein [Isosphaerales bacterium]
MRATGRGRLAMRTLAGTALMIWVSLAEAARGDEFGRLEGGLFFEIPRRADTHTHASLSFRDLEMLPAVLHDERAGLLIVKTDQGNLAKLLVSAGLRKLEPAEDQGPLVPVLILDRFETIDAGDRRSYKARGKGVTLFEGFQFDLDTGQVVPEGFGGDIQVAAGKAEGPRLAALGRNRLYTLDKPLPAPSPVVARPSSGRTVQPGDFAGRYDLIANGQWSGSLDLAVDAAGSVSGYFRSDRNGTASPVTGKVAAEVPQKVSFTVQFPGGARQFYEGLLWSEGKDVIAGTLSMLDHPYSFVAIREGASLTNDAIDFSPGPAAPARTTRRVVSLAAGSDRYTLNGRDTSPAELTATLSKAVKDEPATTVLLRVPDAVPFERVRRAASDIRAAGVRSIGIAPAESKEVPG